jgi:CRP-like cAMP-binding protein
MNNDSLKKYIQMIYPTSDEYALKIVNKFKSFSILKSTILIPVNKINRQTYFIETGYVRSFVLNSEDHEVTTNIFAAPCFVNDFISFFKQQPVRESFIAMTDCSGWTMSYDNVEQQFHQSPEFREFGRLLVLHNYELLKNRMLGLMQDTAEQRYLNMLSRHPDIFQNIPLRIIASYLGITDTSLSRIRKEIFQK